MKVKMITSMAGRDFSLSRGDEYECEADEAQQLVAAGFAVFVREVKVERAVAKPKIEKASG